MEYYPNRPQSHEKNIVTIYVIRSYNKVDIKRKDGFFMNKNDIELLSKNIGENEKRAIENINTEEIKRRIGNMDLKAASQKMRMMNLGEAADRLESMTKDDIINQISKNPEVIDKLKKLFK